jgi:hypothetical protein
LIAVLPAACRRPPGHEANTTTSVDSGKAKPAELLEFPKEMLVSDTSVNDFVTKAMIVCATGDYEAFRLLWTARENPLPREEFEQGWNAVERIEVRALQEARLEADPAAGRETHQTVYVLLVDVSLDASQRAGQKEPLRHVVLMLTRENGEWRLARPPKAMREWVKKKAAPEPSMSDTRVAPVQRAP